jgi:CRISPR-associated protein Cmr3
MLAGAVRTRMVAGRGTFDLAGPALEELKKIPVQGPLLAELAEDSEQALAWFAPAPRDALFVRNKADQPVLRALRPRPLEGRELVDGLAANGLMPVSSEEEPRPGKAPLGIPAFWRWEKLAEWLRRPVDREPVDLAELGITHLPVERRVHISIQPGERVGIDGALFETAGLRFLQPGPSSLAPRRFALSLRVGESEIEGRRLALLEQVAPLGGERRLAHWAPAQNPWPSLPPEIRQRISETRRARLILATPALFANGALPGWSNDAWPYGGNVRATVRAACVPRPDIVSGWDLAYDNGPGKKKGRPKPTRRLAPAGSVYFIELAGATEDVARWCETTWLAPVSDFEQERQDGFGLAFLGTWEDPT